MDQNVKRLLEEEQRVNQMVKTEKDNADQLMRTIKKEVEIAIRSYKGELEKKFDDRVTKMTTDMGKNDVRDAYGVSMDQLKIEYTANREDVCGMLIQQCMQVDTRIPRVVKGHFDKDQ